MSITKTNHVKFEIDDDVGYTAEGMVFDIDENGICRITLDADDDQLVFYEPDELIGYLTRIIEELRKTSAVVEKEEPSDEGGV